ncbi:sensor histidine kinase [Methylobacterium sp. J-068]|uniref:sensor histidine kinase n=1 Tax=Methylobacterium sp. J-068 TaxID=2836649 RepID=UPI001FB9E24E|nr:PAS domain-containing sensor histidine kinase [Methylobacterium sp. J-068]MCJ2032693.1 PAS domain-containing sensor histidine kinase [Methylobacterium sp. J-068]
MSVLRIYGALASLIDVRLAGLVHESVMDESGVRFRHERFLVSRLATGLMMMLGLPPYLVLRGVPTGLEALAIASLMLPVFAAVLLSRTGILWLAHAISSAGLTGVVVCLAMMTGGPQSAAAIWLVAIPLEAVVSGSRRATLAAAIIAGLGALAVALLPPIAEGTPLLEWSRALAMPVFAITAIGHIAAQAIEHFRHEGHWLARLRDNERRDRMLLSAIDDLVTWHDHNGRVLEASASAARFVGADPVLLQGHGLLERVQVADRPLLLQALSDVAAHGRPATVGFRLHLDAAALRAEGAPRVIFAEMRIHRIDEARAGADGAPSSSVVAVTRDVTEHRRHAEELEQARAEAERADEVKSRFLANVSHELRTPLNAIIGFSEVLAGEGAMAVDPARTREYAGIIRNSGQHLLEVVNTLLDMSRIQSGHFDYAPEPLDMSALVRTCGDLMQLKFDQAGITLVRDANPAPVEITADLRACRQMLINLLSNALKFTPRGGRVEIVLRWSGDRLDLIVADSGIGIAESDLPRVGVPFYQCAGGYERTHEGTGLGLSVVQGLVGLHGGAIAIESTRGEGTTVIVTLPRDCRQAGGPVPVVSIRTRLRPTPVDGRLVAPAVASLAAMRRPMGLFEAGPETVRESYVPLRRAG